MPTIVPSSGSVRTTRTQKQSTYLTNVVTGEMKFLILGPCDYRSKWHFTFVGPVSRPQMRIPLPI
jgi:hypothetical protein